MVWETVLVRIIIHYSTVYRHPFSLIKPFVAVINCKHAQKSLFLKYKDFTFLDDDSITSDILTAISLAITEILKCT